MRLDLWQFPVLWTGSFMRTGCNTQLLVLVMLVVTVVVIVILQLGLLFLLIFAEKSRFLGFSRYWSAFPLFFTLFNKRIKFIFSTGSQTHHKHIANVDHRLLMTSISFRFESSFTNNLRFFKNKILFLLPNKKYLLLSAKCNARAFSNRKNLLYKFFVMAFS